MRGEGEGEGEGVKICLKLIFVVYNHHTLQRVYSEIKKKINSGRRTSATFFSWGQSTC